MFSCVGWTMRSFLRLAAAAYCNNILLPPTLTPTYNILLPPTSDPYLTPTSWHLTAITEIQILGSLYPADDFTSCHVIGGKGDFDLLSDGVKRAGRGVVMEYCEGVVTVGHFDFEKSLLFADFPNESVGTESGAFRHKWLGKV